MVYIDSTSLTHAAIGGALLGIASSINYVVRGKVTGMSGLMYSLVSFNRKEFPDKLTLLGGMLFVSSIFFAIFGYSTYADPGSPIPFGPKPQIVYGLSYFGFIISGLLVGFGTKLSNGCTSGHGLCGLPRFSLRSFVAVCIFLVTGILIATLKQKFGLPFITSSSKTLDFSIDNHKTSFICLILGIGLPVISFYLYYVDHGNSISENLINQLISFSVGAIFGLGLLTSGMTRRAKINAFLTFDENWDPSLLVVLGVGVLINLFTFNYIIHINKTSIRGDPVFNPQNSQVDWSLVLGAFCFGLGWGIGSLCPGPFLMLFSVFSVEIQIFWGLACIAGMFIASYVSQIPSTLSKVSEKRSTRGSRRSQREI